MPKAYPKEFRDDVVAVAQRCEAGVTIKEIADDFGILEACLQNWLRKADVESGRRAGVGVTESSENRELRRRNRLLEQENEVLRRAAAYLSQANLPGKGSTCS
jgi:transposase-like protein